MFIFYKELSLADGFDVADAPKASRIVGGREVSLCSGIELFQSLREQPIKCWRCKCVADRWVSVRHYNDHRTKPVLNLYGIRTRTIKGGAVKQELVLMTRDHIIPKSLGGVDDIANLRPGCEVCNRDRSSNMNKQDTKFMNDHPELIDPIRAAAAQEAAERMKAATAAAAEQSRIRKAAIANAKAISSTGGWQHFIGQKVTKSRKPFKSGSKVNTVAGVVIHHPTGLPGFTFVEDDSVVECWRCQPFKGEV